MTAGGAFLRLGSTGLRILEFGCSAVALGIFSYFLAILADHDLPIARRWQAVEGMTGAATLYTIFGVLLTICLGGVTFFGFIAVVLDVLFCGCFIAVAILTRDGAGSCRGFVSTPLGDGQSNTAAQGYGANGFGFGSNHDATYFPNLHTACRLNTAVFAVSIINVVLFLLTAVVQVALVRHHKKEKRYGPSPSNNYTSGRGKLAFWKRNKRNTRDAEVATTLPATTTTVPAGEHYVRPSGETGYTGHTIGNDAYTSEPKYGQPGYGQATNY